MIIFRIAVFLCLHLTVLSLNLECDRKNGDWLQIGIIPTCWVKNAVFTSVGSEITLVDNKDESTSMLGLNFYSQTVHYLPRGLEKFFPNLQALSISSSSLKSIEKADLKPFKYLKVLNLVENKLETLASDLFEFNTKLEWIYFCENPLKNVGENILTPLINLKYANFEDCNCIHKRADSAEELESLMTTLKSNCPESEEMKMRRKYCSHDIDELNKKILELTIELHNQKQEVVDLKGKLEASSSALKSSKESCDASTRELTNELRNQKLEVVDLKGKLEASSSASKSCKESFDASSKNLTNDLQTQKQEVADLKGKVKTFHLASRALDGNLNTATRQLFMASEQLKFNKGSLNELITDRKLVLICRREANSDTFNAVDFKVESSNTQLIRIEDENGTSIGSNVKSLLIVNQQTFFLPTKLAEHLPAIEDLIVDSSGFYEITSSTFEGMRTLTSLSLPRNKLYVIPSDAFKDLMNLKELDLSQNKLKTLETGAFNGLEKLEKITLNDNSLTVARSEVFGTLKSLKHLLFGDNKLTVVGVDLLSTFTSIVSVDFTNNLCLNTSLSTNTIRQIETLINENCISPIELFCETQETSSFCKAVNMTIVDAMTKVSKVVGIEAAVNESLVTTFIVVNQSIKFMPHQLAQVFPNLESIKVDNSGLKSLQKSDFQGLTKLKTIVICNNSLSVISEGTFDEVQQIEHLDLSRNQIVSLKSKVFFYLIHLENLILTGNKFTMLKADLIPPTNAIKILKLDGNNLNFIESKNLKHLRNAMIIDLSGNKCIDLVYERMIAADQRAFRNFYNDVEFECSSET